MITAAEVVRRVAEVQAMADAGDDEAAHSYEDDLYRMLLKAIAADEIDYAHAQAFAAAALATQDIEFARWCA